MYYLILQSTHVDGEFAWDTDIQGYILSSFFYGYVITQIPFGILAKKYGNIYFLGIGMLINSVFAFLVPVSASWGIGWLIAIRFIQGLGEVSTVGPCRQHNTPVRSETAFLFGTFVRHGRRPFLVSYWSRWVGDTAKMRSSSRFRTPYPGTHITFWIGTDSAVHAFPAGKMDPS